MANRKHIYLYRGSNHQEAEDRSFLAWAANAADFHKLCPWPAEFVYRVASNGVEAPRGYRKTGRELACDPAERVPTQADLVRALTPRKS